MTRPPVVIPVRPGAPPAADLGQYEAALDAAAKLSDASKTHYKMQLKRLTETTGHAVEWILANPKPAMRLLLDAKRTDGKRMLEVPMTIKAMIDSLVALLKHVPGLKERYPKAREAWDALYAHVCAQSDVRYENNEATEKGQENFVPWAEIVERRDELIGRGDQPNMDAVVVAMHTMMPPARSDYGKLRVYRPPTDPVPAAESAVLEPNRIVWTAATRKAGHRMHLVLDEYKTRTKKKKAHEADLPDDLTALLVRSLQAQPRRYLVVRGDGAPYESATAYAQLVTRVFSALTGKHTTINSLRHAYSSQLDFNVLTPKERREIADALMHSPEMTHRYRYINIEAAAPAVRVAAAAPATTAASSGEGKAKTTVGTCELVCRKKAQAEAGKRWLDAGKRRSAAVSTRALESSLVNGRRPPT